MPAKYRRSRLITCAVVLLSMLTANAQSPVLDWQTANNRRMFVLTSDQQPISAIAVDTTHIEDLRAAIKLQELVYRIGKARLLIVDKKFVRVPWGKIHIAWDHFPATSRKHPFTIRMLQSEANTANPEKRVVIAGAGTTGVEHAVSAFTQAAFGVPLHAIDNKSLVWTVKPLVAIPEKFATIYGKHSVE